MEEKKIIREYINNNLIIFDDQKTFLDSDNIFQKGFVNSLFAMKLLNFVETQFSIKFDDEDMQLSNFSSIDNIKKLITKKKGTQYGTQRRENNN